MLKAWPTSDMLNSGLFGLGMALPDGCVSPRHNGGQDVTLPLWSVDTQRAALKALFNGVLSGLMEGSVLDDTMAVYKVLPLRHVRLHLTPWNRVNNRTRVTI